MTLLRSAECVIVPGSLCSVVSARAMMSRRLVWGFMDADRSGLGGAFRDYSLREIPSALLDQGSTICHKPEASLPTAAMIDFSSMPAVCVDGLRLPGRR